MKTKICKGCNKELPLNSFNKNKKLKDGHEGKCKECRKESRKIHTIICCVCGKEFKARSKKIKCCSQECKHIEKGRVHTEKKTDVLNCKMCGKEFRRPQCRQNEGDNVFCSRECTDKYHTGENASNYNPNLTDEDRQGRRGMLYMAWINEVYKKDNYTCQYCGTKNGKGDKVNLNAHHKDGYHWCIERRIDISNGVTLCEDCHKLFHHIYGTRNNTEEQWEEFINNKDLRDII